jgi:hemolysin type calcium-binding protein
VAFAGMGAGGTGVCVVRRCLVELAVLAASVRRVWGRAALAFVVVLAAACLSVPGAQAWSTNMEIAFQANTGDLWTWTIDNPGSNTGMGMMAGTNPSVAPLSGFGSDHEIAFQANTGYLWTTGAFGQGRTIYGVAPGTSPSIAGSEIAFQAQGGDLWTVGLGGQGDTGLGMMAGTSPSIAGSEIAFVANTGDLWADQGIGSGLSGTDTTTYAGTSPSVNANNTVAYEDSFTQDLWAGNPAGNENANNVISDSGVAMSSSSHTEGSSPSINDNDDIAFQASNGDLYVLYKFHGTGFGGGGAAGGGDTGAKMMPGTSPSIDDNDDVAFQGSNGNLWIWIAPASGVASGAHDLGMGMKGGTSPAIGRDPGGLGGARPQTSKIGGPGNDRLNGRSQNDLIYGGRGNDLIRGARGEDQLYGGPGSDRIYGGPENDRIYGGPGNDRIVDHRGATTVFPGSGTNRVDVADRRSDDRVVCAPGSTNHIVADQRDRIARSCRGKRSTIRYVRSRQLRSTH